MNFKVFLLIFALPIFLSKYSPIFTDIFDISIKFKNIRNFILGYNGVVFMLCYRLMCLSFSTLQSANHPHEAVYVTKCQKLTIILNDQNIGKHGYIGNWILRKYRNYR